MRIQSLAALLASVVCAGLATTAMAQSYEQPLDPSYEQPFDPSFEPSFRRPLAPIWNGLYLGAHGGGGLGSANDGVFDVSGGFGGLHGGYQIQSGNLILGAEVEVMLGEIAGSASGGHIRTFLDKPWASIASASVSADTVAALKGRIGYATGPFLFYATGGVAWALLDVQGAASGTIGSVSFNETVSGSDALVGWTAGAGAEMKLTQSISARFDVSHYRFTDDFEDGALEITNADIEFTTVRAGLTFHLN